MWVLTSWILTSLTAISSHCSSLCDDLRTTPVMDTATSVPSIERGTPCQSSPDNTSMALVMYRYSLNILICLEHRGPRPSTCLDPHHEPFGSHATTTRSISIWPLCTHIHGVTLSHIFGVLSSNDYGCHNYQATRPKDSIWQTQQTKPKMVNHVGHCSKSIIQGCLCRIDEILQGGTLETGFNRWFRLAMVNASEIAQGHARPSGRHSQPMTKYFGGSYYPCLVQKLGNPCGASLATGFSWRGTALAREIQ